MAQMVRCPLTGESCNKSIRVAEKTFFLAEPKEPEDARNRRGQAIRLALEDKYKIRSALEERQPYAFTCKICEMIQSCVYGIADLTGELPNVVLELGMMLALGKPVIILRKKGAKKELELPSDVRAIEAIPFEEYIDILKPLKEMAETLLPPLSPPTPIAEIEKLSPPLAEELNKKLDTIVKEFYRLIKEAKLETISPREERIEIPLEIARELGKREESLRSFDKLGLTMDADTAFYRGNLHYERQEYTAALEQYNWFLTLKPDFPEAFYNRGTTYGRMEQYDNALADFEKALQLRPDYPEALNNRGATYIKLGETYNKPEHYEEALTDLDKVISLKPDYIEAISNRGNAYLGLKRYEDALAAYNRLLQLKPDDLTVVNNRGVTYLKLGTTYSKPEYYGEALADFNQALKIKPDYPLAVYNMACLFSLWRKPGEAISYLEKAIALDKVSRQKAIVDTDFDNIRDDHRFQKLTKGD